MYRINGLRGKRIVINDFLLEDAFEMSKWGVHQSFLFGDYNFDNYDREDFRYWYKQKTVRQNRYYSVYEGKRLIGYFGIKNISKVFKKSTLGIVLDPNLLGFGYGTEILSVFLPYYFNKFRMRKIDLEVADYNYRAISLYEKMGFERVGYCLKRFYLDTCQISKDEIYPYLKSFEFSENEVYQYLIKMELKRKR